MARKIVRKAEDAAGIGPYARERERLVPMSELRGWNVIDGEADIRSWEVKTISGRVLGSVRELLVDPKAGEAVMIDVDLAGTDRHAYLPLRVVELDRVRRQVRADSGDLEEADAGTEQERARYSSEELPAHREVRYANASGERVVDRRPVVEETVVRRRSLGEGEELEEPDSRI